MKKSLAFAPLAITFWAALTQCKSGTFNRLNEAVTPDADRSAEVQAIFARNCAECHAGGAAEGGFGNADNLAKVAANSALIKPGSSSESRLWQRVGAKEMPPSGASSYPTDDEREIIRKWIDDGALVGGNSNRQQISPRQALVAIANDIQTIAPGSRKFYRYLSIRHLHNQLSNGAPTYSDADLQAFRHGLSHLVNSLHWKPSITPIETVEGTDGSILRLDLRNYTSALTELAAFNQNLQGLIPMSGSEVGLSIGAWEQIAKEDPYTIDYQNTIYQSIKKELGTSTPVVRGDLFVFIAGRGHEKDKVATQKFKYYRILGIPEDASALDKILFKGRTVPSILADLPRSQSTGVIRSGFAGSGVSNHNRLIERHNILSYRLQSGANRTSTNAYYWVSYDFSNSLGNAQLETHPLGPVEAFSQINGGKSNFVHDGGEVIFTLPNGLHAYTLITAKGAVLSEGPITIVRDRNVLRTTILNAVSCMDCHQKGMLPKPDTIGDAIRLNHDRFTDEERVRLDILYPQLASGKIDRYFELDSKAYLAAKAEIAMKGASLEDKDFRGTAALFDNFISDVSVSAAAAEADLTEDAFLQAIKDNTTVRQVLPSFRSENGQLVKRETFREFYRTLAKELDFARSVPDDTVSSDCRWIIMTPRNTQLGKTEFTSENECLAQINQLITSGYRCQRIKCAE